MQTAAIVPIEKAPPEGNFFMNMTKGSWFLQRSFGEPSRRNMAKNAKGTPL